MLCKANKFKQEKKQSKNVKIKFRNYTYSLKINIIFVQCIKKKDKSCP